MAFDSEAYAWKNVEVRLAGTLLTAIKGVKYNVKQERTSLYGKGNDPQAIVDGNRSYEGSVMLHQHEMERLSDSAPQRDLTLMAPFNIVVSYMLGTRLVTDTLVGCRINEAEHAPENGQAEHVITLPFVFMRRDSQV